MTIFSILKQNKQIFFFFKQKSKQFKRFLPPKPEIAQLQGFYFVFKWRNFWCQEHSSKSKIVKASNFPPVLTGFLLFFFPCIRTIWHQIQETWKNTYFHAFTYWNFLNKADRSFNKRKNEKEPNNCWPKHTQVKLARSIGAWEHYSSSKIDRDSYFHQKNLTQTQT